jgi:hypothetical protein
MVLGEVANTKQGNQFYVNVVGVASNTITLANAQADTGASGTALTGYNTAGLALVRDMGKKVVHRTTSGAIKSIYKKVQLVVDGATKNEGVSGDPDLRGFYIKVFPASSWASITL